MFVVRNHHMILFINKHLAKQRANVISRIVKIFRDFYQHGPQDLLPVTGNLKAPILEMPQRNNQQSLFVSSYMQSGHQSPLCLT
jgi:hypothetical protein